MLRSPSHPLMLGNKKWGGSTFYCNQRPTTNNQHNMTNQNPLSHGMERGVVNNRTSKQKQRQQQNHQQHQQHQKKTCELSAATKRTKCQKVLAWKLPNGTKSSPSQCEHDYVIDDANNDGDNDDNANDDEEDDNVVDAASVCSSQCELISKKHSTPKGR